MRKEISSVFLPLITDTFLKPELNSLMKYPYKKPYCLSAYSVCIRSLIPSLILAIIGLVTSLAAKGQFEIDSSYIQSFEKTNDLEVYTGVNKTSFRFRKLTNDNFISQHKLFANTSAYTGVTIDYNWLSLSYSWNIPNTSVAKQSTSIKALSINFRKAYEKFLFEMGTDKYKGLILLVDRRQGQYEYYDNINYRSYFSKVTYVFNAERFSTKAARSFSQLQAKSAGTFMFSLSPFFQRFTLKGGFNNYEEQDSVFLYEISRKPSSVTLIVTGGYTYNFVFNEGEWSINPGIFMGPAIQKNYLDKGHSLKLISNYQLTLNGGYNGEQWYFHVNANYNKIHSNLMNSKMSLNDRGVSLTIGYRMGKLKNKIFGVL